MLFLIIFLSCLFIAIGTGILAGWSDFRGLTIPNLYSAVILGAFVLAWVSSLVLGTGGVPVFSSIWSHLAAMLIVFFATYAMFAGGMIGAADSKVGTAFALWFGVKGLVPFLFFMTLAGGVLGLAALVLRRRALWPGAPEGSWIARVQKGENAVPYGIAIALGAFAAMIRIGYFDTGMLAAITAHS